MQVDVSKTSVKQSDVKKEQIYTHSSPDFLPTSRETQGALKLKADQYSYPGSTTKESYLHPPTSSFFICKVEIIVPTSRHV